MLGDWGERSDLTGEMIVRSLETLARERDLERAGYPAAPVAEAIGHYEASLISAGFANAARTRALDALRNELEALELRMLNTQRRPRVDVCSSCRGCCISLPGAESRSGRSGALRLLTGAEGDGADVVRRRDCLLRAMARRNDGAGRFNPEQRAAGTVTLRERPLKK